MTDIEKTDELRVAPLQAAEALFAVEDDSDLAAAMRQNASLAWLLAEAKWKRDEHVRTHGCICFSPNGGMFTWGCRMHSDLLIKQTDWDRRSRVIRGLARRASQLRRSVRALAEVRVDVAQIPAHLRMSDVMSVFRAAGMNLECDLGDAANAAPSEASPQ